jgi:hypothetical protein
MSEVTLHRSEVSQASPACPSDKNSGKMKIDGKLLKVGKLKLWEKILLRWHLFTILPKGLDWDQNREFGLTGWRLTTEDIAQTV